MKVQLNSSCCTRRNKTQKSYIETNSLKLKIIITLYVVNQKNLIKKKRVFLFEKKIMIFINLVLRATCSSQAPFVSLCSPQQSFSKA